MINKLTKEKVGLEKISPSALGVYEGCPKLFYYQYWLGLSLEQDKRHMDFGSAVHNAIGTIYSLYDDNFGGGFAYAENRWQEVEDAFLSKWRLHHITDTSFVKYLETQAGKASGYTDKEQLYEEMKEDGLAMLKSYWKEKDRMLVEYGYDFSEIEIPLKVEMVNPVDSEDKLPVLLSMRIDARNRDRTVQADFKTSGASYNAEETRKKIQGQCYVFGTWMATGKFIPRFDYIILRKGLKSEDRIEVVQLTYDEADMLSFYEHIRSILQKIANREFNRPSIGHSLWCDCKKYEEALLVS